MLGEEGQHSLRHGFGLFREEGMACILDFDNFNLLGALVP